MAEQSCRVWPSSILGKRWLLWRMEECCKCFTGCILIPHAWMPKISLPSKVARPLPWLFGTLTDWDIVHENIRKQHIKYKACVDYAFKRIEGNYVSILGTFLASFIRDLSHFGNEVLFCKVQHKRCTVRAFCFAEDHYVGNSLQDRMLWSSYAVLDMSGSLESPCLHSGLQNSVINQR